MSLHRAGLADWDKISPSKRNVWQRLGAATGGLVTPGNLLTAIGFGLVVYGLYLLSHDALAAGIIALGAGRVFDIADGWAARRTHTKSPLGEAADATADKLLMGIAVIALLNMQLLPLWAAIILVAQSAYNSLLIIPAGRLGISLHPSQQGKLGTFFAWSSVALWIISRYDDGQVSFHQATELGALLCFGLFIILAGLSSLTYTKQVLDARRT